MKLSLALKCEAIADPASIFLDKPKLVRLRETNTAPVIISGLLMFNSFSFNVHRLPHDQILPHIGEV